MKITSYNIKYALMSYFRFKRQWNCADEVINGCSVSDVLVDTGKYTMDVEIKISKNDLINGEKKKNKHHQWYNNLTNKFALCVPVELEHTALEWINSTNKKYGLYVYYPDGKYIITKKQASKLHDIYTDEFKNRIIKRLGSALITYMGKQLIKNEE